MRNLPCKIWTWKLSHFFLEKTPMLCVHCKSNTSATRWIERSQIRTRIRPHHLPHFQCDLNSLWIGNWLKLDFGFGTSHMFHHPMSGQKHSNIKIPIFAEIPTKFQEKWLRTPKYKNIENLLKPKWHFSHSLLRWEGFGEFKQIRSLPQWRALDQVLQKGYSCFLGYSFCDIFAS